MYYKNVLNYIFYKNKNNEKSEKEITLLLKNGHF